jgi:hypothetical protein
MAAITGLQYAQYNNEFKTNLFINFQIKWILINYTSNESKYYK